ncbi:MAG: sigma-70 family RNA polymerase sigma factor [Prevotellaceae bacterium]|nr:sigma-70 family RNA polymerase sigma factor [Prevotellaceae bacterium]MDD5992224.1 sigma-70 family RNA polymerase sigma factor [Prevotellaceae bacterium]MDD6007984.1 sigma-70 family RNA polymerase sigma factor [Prevotellaceae bacterium]MDD6112539.1 sigma-70 family RNA polymerase sigma factor [Prevotellaceae bacterium]MDD6780623.1 sigma-70 family RNA polymerase sigma factor [Prevotellaceae bacterium]
MEEKNVMTDEQLAIDYMAGDNKAFDELLRRYKNKVFSSVYNMINDRLAAEDVFQDIFIRIIVGLRENRYTSKGYFKFWVATITRNAIIDYHRKNKILLADVNEDNDLCTLKGQDVIDICKEESIVNKQTLDNAVKLMNHLPETQREVVYMKFFENKSFKEIAEQTNVSINTSLGRMRYALINMRRMAREHKVL